MPPGPKKIYWTFLCGEKYRENITQSKKATKGRQFISGPTTFLIAGYFNRGKKISYRKIASNAEQFKASASTGV